jgi:hypothetical protein
MNNNNDVADKIIEKKQKQEIDIDVVMEYEKTWQLNNYVEDITYEELYNGESEDMKLVLLMMKKFYEKKSEVYKRIKSAIPKKKTPEIYRWEAEVLNGPKRGTDIEIYKLKQRLEDL